MNRRVETFEKRSFLFKVKEGEDNACGFTSCKTGAQHRDWAKRGVFQRSRGFSLLELLVALAILSVGLFALAGLQKTAIEGNAASRNLTSAVFLAEAKMNELQAKGYSNLSPGAFSDSNNPVNERGEPGGIFARTWTVSGHGVNMKQITVSVSWKDGVGDNRSTSLDTVISDTMD
jgi:type IV pilus assembly protein PilV